MIRASYTLSDVLDGHGRWMVIVSRDQSHVYETLAQQFAGHGQVKVILDRRHPDAPPALRDRRRGPRAFIPALSVSPVLCVPEAA